MFSGDLSLRQLCQLYDKLRPNGKYLEQLTQRIHAKQFPTDDRMLIAAEDTQLATRRLMMEIRTRTLRKRGGWAVWRFPDQELPEDPRPIQSPEQV